MPNHITTAPSNSSLVANRGSRRIAYVGDIEALPTTGSIVEQLKHAGIVSSSNDLNLLLLPRNPLRLDFSTRVDFRVNRGATPVCYLTVGRNLADLRSRTIAIAKACPDVTCRPLSWRRVDGWDYFATEYFEGGRLDAEFLGGRISAAQVEKCLNYVMGQLERTIRPSATIAVERELDRLFRQAAELPVFGAFDRILLEKIIFSFVRSGALSARPQTRWTNGDLIPGNILVSPSGEVRLIDYEFASRTHFPAIDAWRWARFSRLPPELRSLAALAGENTLDGWAKAICILQQLILLQRIHPAAIALDESRLLARELMDLTTSAHSDFRGDVLVRSLAARAEPALPAPTTTCPKVQLFWSASSDYNETRSLSFCYPESRTGVFRFEIHDAPEHVKLRLDPTDSTGLLEISAIRVRHQPSNRTLLSLSESTGWDSLRLVNDILRLPDTPFLNMLSLGDDPVLELPDINTESTGGLLTVEVWIRFSAGLQGLQLMLPSPLLPSADAHRIQPEPSEQQRCASDAEASLQVIDPCAEPRSDPSGNAAKLASLIEENQRLEAAYTTALAQVGKLESTTAEAERTAAECRTEAAHAAEQSATLESELHSFRQQLEARTSAEKAVTTKLDSLIEEHSKLASAHCITKSEAEHTAIELAQATDRIATLQNELAESRKRETAQTMIAQEAVAEAKREKHIREQQVRDSMGERQVALQEASTALARLELLSKRTAALESQHAAAALRAEVTIAQLEESRRNTAELATELAQAHNRHASAQQVIQSQEEKIALQDKDIFAQRSEHIGLQNQIEALRVALETTERERQYYIGRCTRMTSSLSWRCTVPLRWLRRKFVDHQTTETKPVHKVD